MRVPLTLALPWLACALPAIVRAFEVDFQDTDYSRQICSGMWGGGNTHINVTFDESSQGQVAMVIYEWADWQYLGVETSVTEDYLPQKTYVCTSNAALAGFCTTDQLGQFILDLPDGMDVSDTSFWSARVQLSGSASSEDNSVALRQDNVSPTGVYAYSDPIQYIVRKTGYYCVAIVPISVQSSSTQVQARQDDDDADVPYHPSYKGTVLFRNKFNGKLAAADYPKVNFYFAMFVVYLVFASVWGWLCYKHRTELLPIQYYLSSLVGLIVIEMLASWAYYRYLNAHGRGTSSTVFLIVVAVLDAARNSMSFFMLLVVSLGLSVVRESLGRTMLKCQILAGAHFIFGILYAIGIVELELESASALVLLLFVIPLAFTLSGFLLWIMYALNGTINELKARKQRYKLHMFELLHRILLGAVAVIIIFFIVSSFSFSGRLAEDYSAKSWRSRWWLLDGWLALLYLVAFASISFLWRPSEHNRRLAMSEELAQDEEDAEDYDLEALERRGPGRPGRDEDDDDEATLVGTSRGAPGPVVGEDAVVFEIGDEDEDDEATPKKRTVERLSGEQGRREERQGLMRDRDD
ncbi:lung seven transmembrane receptor-domain-containing protein [Schizophyllum amplum]|uniref:Lung seven transmembrane receptor-domain-containing protein n=1 Tax=Schizophyllum amplum TaxID=97359 RepID=A0A550CM87_9AGAR|nr:lung seven transmembrane receptor-domain-containing protein [Auriculariopsis ampla]